MVTKKQTTTIQPAQQPNGGLISDVARPGLLPPADATTRPVIVTNRSLAQDPMMAPLQPDTAASVGQTATGSRRTIQPVTSTIEDLEIGFDSNNDGVVSAAEAVPADQTTAAAPTPPIADTATQPALDDHDGFETPEFAKSKADKETLALEAAAKAADEIDDLVEQETYFLPINAGAQRRSRNVFIFGSILIVLLALAWIDIALDAGFITIPGLQPLTHFFAS